MGAGITDQTNLELGKNRWFDKLKNLVFMKRVIAAMVFASAFCFAPQIVLSQGTLYVSNLNEPSELAGNFSWTAINFETGVSPLGYNLNSIQINTAGLNGNPSSDNLFLYSDNAGLPGNSISLFSAPVTTGDGIYTFTASNTSLTPLTTYWIVDPASVFYWDIPSSGNYTSSDGWSMNSVGMYFSYDGVSWYNTGPAFLEFAVNATAVPEPSVFGLLALGVLFFGIRRSN